MKKNSDDYILGTSDAEIERLRFQHDVWRDSVLPLWKTAGYQDGQAILDLGCGPGFASMDLAGLVGPQGRVLSVDVSQKYIRFLEEQIQASNQGNIETMVGDVQALDIPDNSLDGVFIRWVLCFLINPGKVISEAARVLRPGGTLVIMDYFNYRAVNIFPKRKSFSNLFEAYYQSLLDAGGTYDIGHFAPTMVRKNNLEILEMKPINHIARPGSEIWRWLLLFTEGYVPKLVKASYLTEAESETLWEDLEEVENDPATFFYTPPVIGIVAKKPLS